VNVTKGQPADVAAWMSLVARIRENFPGLETQELMEAHRLTVLRFMSEGRALCAKEEEEIIGVLLLSVKYNMICCMAVVPEHRRRGIGSALLQDALALLDKSRDITVNTFREEDEKGTAPRALYMKYGFEPCELLMDNGYPEQRFVLRAKEARA